MTAAHVHLAYKRIGDQWQKIRAVLPPSRVLQPVRPPALLPHALCLSLLLAFSPDSRATGQKHRQHQHLKGATRKFAGQIQHHDAGRSV